MPRRKESVILLLTLDKTNQLHVPNMYPHKLKMIEQLSNRKQTGKNKELLDSLMLKTQGKMNLSVIKQDDEWEDVREEDFDENGQAIKE